MKMDGDDFRAWEEIATRQRGASTPPARSTAHALTVERVGERHRRRSAPAQFSKAVALALAVFVPFAFALDELGEPSSV